MIDTVENYIDTEAPKKLNMLASFPFELFLFESDKETGDKHVVSESMRCSRRPPLWWGSLDGFVSNLYQKKNGILVLVAKLTP